MASVLILIESDDDGLGISSSQAGALGSVFIVGYILTAPLAAHLA